jgi:hypothetical protein
MPALLCLILILSNVLQLHRIYKAIVHLQTANESISDYHLELLLAIKESFQSLDKR